jgi:outer membrane immunogenic protein
VILLETKVQRIIFVLIVTAVLGLAYASNVLAADMTVPPPDCSQMGKAPPDFLQVGKAPPDCSQMGMGKAPPAFLPGIGKGPPDFLEMGKGKAPPPIVAKGPMGPMGPMLTKAMPLPPPALPSWTGFYLGGDAGAAWLSEDATWNPLPDPVTFGASPILGKDKATGFIGGAHIGYNDQVMPDWVAGVEGDWSWTKTSGALNQAWTANGGGGVTVAPGSQTSMNADLHWIASARLRVGYLLTPSLMGYVTGGGAWANIGYSGVATNNGNGYLVNFNSSSTQAGYVAGAGLEWMMTDNWTVRAEYLYYQFGKGLNVDATQPAAGGFPSNLVWSKPTISVAQAGLSYKF